MGKATDFRFGWYIHRAHSEQKPINNFEQKGAWAYPGAAQNFAVVCIVTKRTEQMSQRTRQ